MSKIISYFTENPKLVKDFKKWYKREQTVNTYKTSGSYNAKYKTFDGALKEFRTIIFYEWSNPNGSYKTFFNLKDFLDFLEECKIIPLDYQETSKIEKMRIIHACCLKDKPKIVFEDSKDKLKV